MWNWQILLNPLDWTLWQLKHRHLPKWMPDRFLCCSTWNQLILSRIVFLSQPFVGFYTWKIRKHSFLAENDREWPRKFWLNPNLWTNHFCLLSQFSLIWSNNVPFYEMKFFNRTWASVTFNRNWEVVHQLKLCGSDVMLV